LGNFLAISYFCQAYQVSSLRCTNRVDHRGRVHDRSNDLLQKMPS
jgi:hypothetical protein